MPRMTTLTAPIADSPVSILGSNVQRLRTSAGMTQYRLAEEVAAIRGIDVESARTKIAAIERGRSSDNLEMSWLRAFASVFNVSFSDLMQSESFL